MTNRRCMTVLFDEDMLLFTHRKCYQYLHCSIKCYEEMCLHQRCTLLLEWVFFWFAYGPVHLTFLTAASTIPAVAAH